MHELPVDLEKDLWRYSLGLSHDSDNQPQMHHQDNATDIPNLNNKIEALRSHKLGSESPKPNSSTTTTHTSTRPPANTVSDPRNASEGSQQSDNDDDEDADPRDSAPLHPREFYEIIGMRTPDPQGNAPNNLEAAHGFYGQMCQEKRLVERKYRLYDIVIMFFLVMQIILSAVFIILGALNVDQHVAIAVLGGVSSIIAGVLALMRGQGLPNRLRMERDGLRKVILDADELYWDVGAGREVTYDDVKKIRDAYSAVLEDARRNHPDTWNSTTLADAQGLTKTATSAKRKIAYTGRG